MVATLRAAQFLSKGRHLHVARAHYQANTGPAMHTHAGFTEIFWVERGQGMHLINGQRVALAAGDVVFVRSSDVHGFTSESNEPLEFVNVAFRVQALAELRGRYFAQSNWPFAERPRLPLQLRISTPAIQRLSQWADSFGGAMQSRLERDGFLIDLLRLVNDRQSPRFQMSAFPPWLVESFARVRAAGDFSVSALAQSTGRSREHINRLVRRCTGRTTTDVLNDMRVEEAARRLRMTSDSILDISLDLGISNVAHFYRLFAARKKTTPRRYRLRERALL